MVRLAEQHQTHPAGRRQCPRALFVAAIVAAITSLHGNATLGANSEIAVGLFAPSLPLPSTEARLALVNKLAEHLSRQLGRPVRGLAFSRSTDLDTRLRAGTVNVVLADALYLAERRTRISVVAAAMRGGNESATWVLASQTSMTLAQIKGASVALPRVGRLDRKVANGFMLANEFPTNYFRWIRVPNVASALSLLRVGKVSAALVPEATAEGTHHVARTLAVPLPLLAISKVATQGLQREDLTRAVKGFIDGSAKIDGWRAATASDATKVLQFVKRAPLLSQSPLPDLIAADLFGDQPLPWRLQSATGIITANQTPP